MIGEKEEIKETDVEALTKQLLNMGFQKKLIKRALEKTKNEQEAISFMLKLQKKSS